MIYKKKIGDLGGLEDSSLHEFGSEHSDLLLESLTGRLQFLVALFQLGGHTLHFLPFLPLLLPVSESGLSVERTTAVRFIVHGGLEFDATFLGLFVTSKCPIECIQVPSCIS